MLLKDNNERLPQMELINDLDLSLSNVEQESCEGELTKDELFSALSGLQTSKSPGSDGLPTEFYVAFWGILVMPLLVS